MRTILFGCVLTGLLTAVTARAQTPATISGTTRATAAAPVYDTGWGATVNVNAQLSGGTQQQNLVTLFATAFHERGRVPTALHINTRGRYELTYGNAKKPDLPRITTTEMQYGEFRISANARQLLSSFDGSVSSRGGSTTRFWVYGIAAGYRHLAFDLNVQQARSPRTPATTRLTAETRRGSLDEWLDGVRLLASAPPTDDNPRGACLLPDPAGGPAMCVQIDKNTCNKLKGRFLGGPC